MNITLWIISSLDCIFTGENDPSFFNLVSWSLRSDMGEVTLFSTTELDNTETFTKLTLLDLGWILPFLVH